MCVVQMLCPTCKKLRPHRTEGVETGPDGKPVQRMVCTECGTSTMVPTGSHGQDFQENVDFPDDTEADHTPELSAEKIRVNWHQAQAAADGLLRAHQNQYAQPPECQFVDMKDWEEFDGEAAAQAAMRQRRIAKYKRCTYCWDGEIITLS